MCDTLNCIVEGRPFEVKISPDGVAFSGMEQSPVITGDSRQGFQIRWNGKNYHAHIVSADYRTRELVLRINNHLLSVQVKDSADAKLAGLGVMPVQGKKVNDLRSPMPGMVLQVMAEPGMEVRKGDPLLILEAMKMENILRAPADVKISALLVKQGQAVEKNQILIQFAQ